jgi:ferredoxin-NADP reductase
MTSSSLLLWIVGGILLQLAIYLAISFGRHWSNYQTLRTSVIYGEPLLASPAKTREPEGVTAAWAGLRTFRVTHKIVEDAAAEVCSFHLVPQDGQPLPSFLPGQFLTFHLAIPTAAGGTESITRCYSLSDAPRRTNYRVSIKRAPAPAKLQVPPGRSSNFFHDQIEVGSLLQVRAPAGHFHIEHSDAPVVLVGGGIGITPMLSMLNWCLAEQPGREVWLFYGVRHSQELVTREHLEALADIHPHFHLHLCLSQPGPQDVPGLRYQHHGRVDVDLLRRLLPLKPYHFYICGPTPLLESLVPALEDWGVPDARIHFEAFGPSSVKRRNAQPVSSASVSSSAAEVEVSVNFAKTGKQVPWSTDYGSLLDLAEAHGIAVNTGCRAGGCGSCQTTLKAGQVHYPQAPDFDPEPGSCLMCVCTPTTSVTLEL